jgi:hypothetical protein
MLFLGFPLHSHFINRITNYSDRAYNEISKTNKIKILLAILIVKIKIYLIGLPLCSYLILIQSNFATAGPGFRHWVGISDVR